MNNAWQYTTPPQGMYPPMMAAGGSQGIVPPIQASHQFGMGYMQPNQNNFATMGMNNVGMDYAQVQSHSVSKERERHDRDNSGRSRDRESRSSNHRNRSRSRSRERENRERDAKSSHYGGHRRSRSHSRSLSRSRSRSGSKSRSRSNSRSRSRERDSKERRKDKNNYKSRGSNSKGGASNSNEREWDRGKSYPRKTPQNFQQEQYEIDVNNPPPDCKGVILRGLKPSTNEEMIGDSIKPFAAVEEVRLIRDKVTGEPRGFAFVDFITHQDTIQFMNYTKGEITIDGARATADWSTKGKGIRSDNIRQQSHPVTEYKDWICPQCNATNFARRPACFTCHTLKPANAITLSIPKIPAPQVQRQHLMSREDDSIIPGPVLVVRGLNGITIEKVLENTMGAYGTVKEIRIIRDKHTQQSRGFGFVEFFSTEEATTALEAIRRDRLKLDGRILNVSFTKRGSNNSLSSMSYNEAIEQAKWLDSTYSYNGGKNFDAPLDAFSIINSGDSSRFVFDNSSGYYFDASSGIYFDMKNNYYYDSMNQTYYQWNEQQQLYLATPNQPTNQSTAPQSNEATNQTNPNPSTSPTQQNSTAPAATGASTPSASETPSQPAGFQPFSLGKSTAPDSDKKKKEKQVSTVVKTMVTSKRVSEAMDKWNQKHNELVEEDKKSTSGHARTAQTVTSTSTPNPTATPSTGNVPTPAIVGLNLPKEVTQLDGADIIVGNVCILCKRQFQSAEQIQKHLQFSDLHKHNLEMARVRNEQKARELEEKRAEDQLLRQLEKQQQKKKAQEGTSSSTSSESGELNEDNIGNQMMQKMGWKKGEGIGKNPTVVTQLIDVEIRAERAGLGLYESGSTENAVLPGDTYHNAVRKRARQRFEQMAEEDGKKQKQQ